MVRTPPTRSGRGGAGRPVGRVPVLTRWAGDEPAGPSGRAGRGGGGDRGGPGLRRGLSGVAGSAGRRPRRRPRAAGDRDRLPGRGDPRSRQSVPDRWSVLRARGCVAGRRRGRRRPAPGRPGGAAGVRCRSGGGGRRGRRGAARRHGRGRAPADDHRPDPRRGGGTAVRAAPPGRDPARARWRHAGAADGGVPGGTRRVTGGSAPFPGARGAAGHRRGGPGRHGGRPPVVATRRAPDRGRRTRGRHAGSRRLDHGRAPGRAGSTGGGLQRDAGRARSVSAPAAAAGHRRQP